MKVLHVMAGAEHGGAETMFSDSVVALHQAGLDQMLVTRPSPLRDALWQQHGIPVRHARFPPPWLGFATAATLRRTQAGFKPDVVHYWMGRAASYAKPGPAANVGWFGGYYDLKYYRHCQFFIGVTRDLERHIVAAGVPPEAAATVHTFADLPPAPPVNRPSLDTPAGVPLLLTLVRLHQAKAVDILLQALAEVPGVYLWIAGEGPLRGELTALCTRLGLDERVRFLGWRTDRAALLAACDVCVLPSRYEPFGTVMVEAWAAGVPLIAAAADGPRAYLEPDRNGLLVPTDDAPALAAAIRRCLGDEALRQQMVAGGRHTYETTFTREVLVRDFLDCYRRAIERRQGSK